MYEDLVGRVISKLIIDCIHNCLNVRLLENHLEYIVPKYLVFLN